MVCISDLNILNIREVLFYDLVSQWGFTETSLLRQNSLKKEEKILAKNLLAKSYFTTYGSSYLKKCQANFKVRLIHTHFKVGSEVEPQKMVRSRVLGVRGTLKKIATVSRI